jgi:hypothetical protein
MKITRILGTVCASVMSLVLISPLKADVIDAYFGMNYVEGYASVPEAMLLDITYVGGGGSVYTTPMPIFYRYASNGILTTGLPDGIGLQYQPTYTTSSGGDGETTRMIGATVPIDWDVASLPFPSIRIISITVEAPIAGAIWTAAFNEPYTVGLIPFGSGNELYSTSPAPQGDIYGYISGTGNPINRVIATSAPRGLEHLVGRAFGDFIFSAATSEPAPVIEICDNGVDDNGDGLVDCAEPRCEGFIGAPTRCGMGACESTGNLVCQAGNNVDTCAPGAPQPEDGFGDATCSDGIDNDCDGLVDAAEPGCAASQEICDNGVDDNGDGLIDCAEPQCEGFSGGACITGQPGICEAGTFVCQSGDQVCNQNQPGVTEGPFGNATCGDGLDNDCDGLTDTEEPDCAGDVFLTQLQVPKRLVVNSRRVLSRGVTVRGDSNTPTQVAAVVLSAAASSNIGVVVEPGSVTQQVALGNPVTQFGFIIYVSCNVAGTGTVDWAATISASVNNDPSNDVLTGTTSVICR